MDESSRGKLTFGLVLLLTGILLFLQLDQNTNAGFGLLWPLYPVLFGVMGMFNRTGKGFSLILLVVGLFFLLRNLNVIGYIPPMYIWPTVIILIALVTIFSAFGGRRRHYTTGDGVRYSAIFGETKETVRDQNVQKISVAATFGGVELDMTQAGIQNEAAVVDVFVLFGSADIIVPENWAVEVRVTPILGGVENKTRPADNQQKKLLLTGSVMFGGASVRAR